MDEEELLLLQGDDGAADIHDHFDESELLKSDAGSNAGDVVVKEEALDHEEELDYEEEEEKEERESRFTSERAKKSPVRAPEEAAAAAAAPKNENAGGFSGRGSYRGASNRGGAGFRGGNFNSRGGMRMAGGGSAGPISLLTSNIPPPMMLGPGMGPKILLNPNFPVGAGLTLLPNPGPGGYGAPPMGLRGPMMPQAPLGPKVTLSIDGAPALAVPVNMGPPPQMGPGPGGPMMMPPPHLQMRPGGPPMVLNPMGAPPPSAMRFPPGMGPPPMNVGMNVPPPGMAPQLAGGPQNWNLMVEAFLGDKKSAGERPKKKKRRRSRSSSYSSSSDSESDYSSSSRSRSRSRSPRKSSRKRSSRGTRKHRKERSSGGERSKGERGGERRVFRTGPNSFRINSAPANGSELPSLLDGMERGRGDSSRSRRADRERQRENDSRDSARALGLDDEYLSRVEEQRRQREELRRRKERSEGGGTTTAAAATRESVRERRGEGRAPTSGRGRNESSSHGNGAAAKDARKKTEAAVEESKRKAYLAVHVKNVGHLGEAALGRVKALANEVGETKKVWRSADDVVTVIFVELDKAKAFMLKYNGKVLSGLRITVGLEKVYLNLSEVGDR